MYLSRHIYHVKLTAPRYSTSPCGPRGSVRRRVVLLPGNEVGGRPSGGEGQGGDCGEREPLATEHHGCVRAFNGYRPPSRLEKGGRNAAGTWCILALCLTRCVMYKSSDRIRTHLARFAKIAE